MTESTTSLHRRAKTAAVSGLILQIVLLGFLIWLGALWRSSLILSVARGVLGGLLIWPVLALIFNQRRRTSDERLETEELKRAQQAGGPQAIFDVQDESYLVERRRLNWMIRWLVPTATLTLAAYLIVGTFISWGGPLGGSIAESKISLTTAPGPATALLGFAGFMAFLFSRYTAGMGRRPGWRLLRAGASYLTGNALACLVALIALTLHDNEALRNTAFSNPEAWAVAIIRFGMLFLGIELVVNWILDFYRPRTSGQVSRPAFDSRLLGLFSEPGGFARSLADAINYQFGFQISGTWFYKLLGRALLPMTAFGVAVLLILSCVVIVDADEQAFTERFGRLMQPADAPLGPGLHFKAPWPIDRTYRARTKRIHTLTVGTPATEDDIEQLNGDSRLKPILWGEKHQFNTEMMLVFASDSPVDRLETGGEKAVPVGLLMVSVDIQYTVGDAHDYLYRFLEPEKTVESLAYQELSKFAAGVTVNQFLGPGRTDINDQLRSSLQERLDAERSGIKILFVGLQEAHPESEVAKSFQDVVKAESEKENMIVDARSQADEVLTQASGSVSRALELSEAIRKQDELALRADADPAELAKYESHVDQLLFGDVGAGLGQAGGTVARQLADVQSDVLGQITEAEQSLIEFQAEIVAHAAAPRIYKVRKYLEMLRESVKDIRKYVLDVDLEKTVIIEFEKKEEGTIDIGDPQR